MTRSLSLLTLLILLGGVRATAQSWHLLPAAPAIRGKQDDLYFIDPDNGWSVNGLGNIFATSDGGSTWRNLLKQPGTYFRCIGFTDQLHGFAGNIGTDYYPNVTDTIPLYATSDGGEHWAPVTAISGPMPKGLCSIFVLDSLHVFGAGRVGGPCHFLSTSDGGRHWRSRDIGNRLGMLIDLYFTSPRHGYAFGCSDVDGTKGHSVILKTTDGGEHWREIFRSSMANEMCWKVSFPSARTGYVAVLARDSSATVLKTTDGGEHWRELKLIDGHYEGKGVGFLDERTGWVAGERPGVPPYRTTDGGATWSADTTLGPYINRIRFVDGVGYAIGAAIYKLDAPSSAPPAMTTEPNRRRRW